MLPCHCGDTGRLKLDGLSSISMVVEARVGIFRGSRVSAEGVQYEVRRLPGSWYEVDAPVPSGRGRVHYSGWRDVIRIERTDAVLEIRFRLRGTSFSWRGRTYRVGSMLWGRVTIDDQGRPVASGVMTLSGVRLEFVSPELEPIARELAFGLALRTVQMWNAFLVAGSVS